MIIDGLEMAWDRPLCRAYAGSDKLAARVERSETRQGNGDRSRISLRFIRATPRFCWVSPGLRMNVHG
jgi:hypothetical protein